MGRQLTVTAALVVLVAACASPGPASSPTPTSESDQPTDAATPAATPGTTGAPSSSVDVPDPGTELAVGVMAEVTVDALNIRSEPGVGQAPSATLDRGAVVYLSEGPISASGYDWYFVSEDPPVFWQPVGCMTAEECNFPAFGWVAIGPSSEPWLRVVDPCPAGDVDALELHQLGPLARLSCLAGEPIVIRVTLSVGAGNGWQMPLGVADPAWLGSEVSPVVLIQPQGGGTAVLPVRFDPSFGDCGIGPRSGECSLEHLDGQVVDVELVADHPAAETCVGVDGEASPVVTLRCRAQLVVMEVSPR